MKITVTGSLGNVSRSLIQKLVTGGHQVNVITSSEERTNEIKKLDATPLMGSVEDVDFLKRAFRGSDAVYLMIPPNFSTPDYKQFTIRVGQNYAAAVKDTGIGLVVNLSSSGSPLAGQPPLEHYQNLEMWLDELPDLNVMHLRPGGFYSNFFGSIDLIKHQGIVGNNFAGNISMVMSHPADIADAAFEALDKPAFKGRAVKYIISDRRSGKEVAEILGAAIGKPDLMWVHFPDEQLLEGLMNNGFSRDAAQHNIVDMGIAIREGILDAHYQQDGLDSYGKRRFPEFAQEFAGIYQHSH